MLNDDIENMICTSEKLFKAGSLLKDAQGLLIDINRFGWSLEVQKLNELIETVEKQQKGLNQDIEQYI